MKQQTHIIAISNGWNTKDVQILHEKHDGKFHLFATVISGIPNTSELMH